MREPAFFVLTALLGGPLHGYGIVSEVDVLSNGQVQVRIGSLYGILDRFVTQGHVELDREEPYQGRLRRYYRITDSGAEMLRAEVARQAANVRAATRRIQAYRPRLGEST
jgi:PadR family transcriptional regulator